jgi:hypothetical protein
VPDRFDLTNPDIAHLLTWVQSGVVARRQLVELGAGPKDIERMLRRRELATVHPGVYVDHTGPLSRKQRGWAAVHALWPAALTRETALPLDDRGVLHLAVHSNRTVQSPPGCVVHRTERLDDWVDWRAGPPAVAIDQALIEVMAARVANDQIASAFAALAQVVHTRLTWPDRLLDALGERSRLSGRTVVTGMVDDLRSGICSVLERGYVQRVERPHGLPRGKRQVTSQATGKKTAQDVRYRQYGLVVELDGRGYHDNPRAWDDDARRDIAEQATSDLTTVRVTYGLVFGDECRTAQWIAAILQRHGWRGQVRPCPRCA